MTTLPADEQLRTQTRAAVQQAPISQAEIARQLGVSTKHLNQMLLGHAPLSLIWAEGILGLCGMEVEVTVRPEKRHP
ncbi:helix-turn-helix domain-containing protein [Streptomyces triticiradicis]|uniref:Helix-turn-helix transcriptional regulator n=1 Tax=Streptomyces triticiradicis TaxID=2651189 RepID=A0A7J5D7K3_9ACTN|nr:helix-turn-helix transcriptional regulator [Streptomyces triticiradicis]KAB1979249.1 helix-turn-helix transcriptional regulator [Streptomyces triticiradicis]